MPCPYCRVYNAPVSGGGKRRKVTVWDCCYCGAGAMLYSTTPVCTTCDHPFRNEFHDVSEPITEQVREISNGPITTAAAKREQQVHAETSETADLTAEPISNTPDIQQKVSPQPYDQMRELLDVKDSWNRHGHPRGTVDTDPTDTETVFSTGSSATTLADPGAVEAFTRNIMTYQSLGCLWPQLVGRYGTEKMSIYVIERLLKRYVRDVALMSREMAASKMSDSRLCHAAARLVRKSRLQIARKIWEAQALDLDNLSEKDTTRSLSDIDGPDLEADEDADGPTDDDLLFEKVEEILFDKGPIFSLQANIKLLLNISNPRENGIVYRLSGRLSTFIGNTVLSLYEPPLAPGYTRLRYTCVSSTNLTLYLCPIPLVHFIKARHYYNASRRC